MWASEPRNRKGARRVEENGNGYQIAKRVVDKWFQGVGTLDKGAGIMPNEAREAFQEIIKFALIMSVFSVVFIMVQAKIKKLLKGKRK